MSHARMSASSVAHKSTGGTLQSLPEPVDPVGDAPDYLTFKTVASLRQRVPFPGILVQRVPICTRRGLIRMFATSERERSPRE